MRGGEYLQGFEGQLWRGQDAALGGERRLERGKVPFVDIAEKIQGNVIELRINPAGLTSREQLMEASRV